MYSQTSQTTETQGSTHYVYKLFQESYEFYDGFLILHGTDTLSYTASALSFMLENLGKTVIITGSQIPIFETRTDGKDNFTSGLILAGNYVIPGNRIDFDYQDSMAKIVFPSKFSFKLKFYHFSNCSTILLESFYFVQRFACYSEINCSVVIEL